MNASQRVAELESLRGLLALWVIVGHLLTASGFEPEHWLGPLKLLGRGVEAVNVFIILSGFAIWNLLDRGGEGYAAFIVRRFFRLYPVYLLCLAAAVLLMPLAQDALRALPWDTAHNAVRLQIFADSAAHFPAQLLAHLSMLHGALPDGILPSAPYAFLGQAWSISLEWQFYLVAPLLFLACARDARAWWALIWGGALCYLLGRGLPQSALPPKLLFFIVGMLGYEAWKHAARIPARHARWIVPGGIALALAARSPALFVWALGFGPLLQTRCGYDGMLGRGARRLLQLRPLLWLGGVSYSLYLCHMSVLYLMLALLSPYAAALGRGAHLAVMAGAVLASSIALAGLLHRYVERPGIRFGKDLVDRQQPAWLAALFNFKKEAA